MSATASVVLDGIHVATLDSGAGAGLASLQYTDDALTRWPTGAPVLSMRLPLRREPYSGVAARPWLDGLLPEAGVRTTLAARAGIDPNDTFSLLGEYGRDCAGAVSIIPAGATSDELASDVLWLDDGDLAAAIRNLPRSPFGTDRHNRVRISLGGVQGKLAVVASGDRIGLPQGLQPSTHLLKPQPKRDDGSDRYPGIVTAEAMSMRFCRALGLDTAEVRALPLETGPALVVTRYDRATDELGAVHRIHQEDFCQALGLDPVLKYQEAGRPLPSMRAIVAALGEYRQAPIPVLQELLGRLAAFAMLTNCDAHAKNWSALLQGDSVELAPVYDVVPSTLWPEVDTTLALTIGGCALVEDLRWTDLLHEAGAWGLGERAARRRLAQARERAPLALETAARETLADGGDPAVVEHVMRIVNARITHLGSL